MRKIDYIVLHHSATDYEAHAGDIDGVDIARIICNNQQNKWLSRFPNYKCDYHFVIGHTGKVFEGQPIEQPGWHATNYQVNLKSIGICFLGNFEKIKMPGAQFNAGVKLIKDLMRQYDIPIKNILGHRDIISDITHHANSTLCPGKNFPYKEMLVMASQKTEAETAREFMIEKKIMQPPPGMDPKTYWKSGIDHQTLAIILYRAYNK